MPELSRRQIILGAAATGVVVTMSINAAAAVTKGPEMMHSVVHRSTLLGIERFGMLVPVVPSHGRFAMGKLVASERRLDGFYEVDFEIIEHSKLKDSDRDLVFDMYSWAVLDPAFVATLPAPRARMG